jgi:anti-sigma factor ChrR (cupin superfamily)
MSLSLFKNSCAHSELVNVYALHGLPTQETPMVDAHLATCAICRQELAALKSVVATFGHWPIDVLRPAPSLWERLTDRIATDRTVSDGIAPDAAIPPNQATHGAWVAAEPSSEPSWNEVAPGISCKLLASDAEHNRVSMLVRLAPGIDYPPHTHAGVEELHLLDGELWIDDKKLYPGDYNRAEPGTNDKRVWSETGCTCVLITSPSDRLSPIFA